MGNLRVDAALDFPGFAMLLGAAVEVCGGDCLKVGILAEVSVVLCMMPSGEPTSLPNLLVADSFRIRLLTNLAATLAILEI